VLLLIERQHNMAHPPDAFSSRRSCEGAGDARRSAHGERTDETDDGIGNSSRDENANKTHGRLQINRADAAD
jgi:hypothetical protein